MVTMNNLSRLLGVTAVGASIVRARLTQRFVSDVARIITLAIAAGIMAGAFLVGGFYAAYQALLRHGLETQPAQLVIASLAAATIIALYSMSCTRMRHLSMIPRQITQAEFPLSSHINGAIDSFLNGLFDSNSPKK